MKADVYFEFATQLNRYMTRFGLYQVDIAFLTDSNPQAIQHILEHKSGLVLKTAEALAGVFNLRYYQLGNPGHPLPALEELPIITRERILLRQKLGPPPIQRYNKLNLNKAIARVLRSYPMEHEFVASQVYGSLSKSLQGRLSSAAKVSDRLAGEFGAYVTKTGKKKSVPGKRGRREEYYRLIKKP